MRMIKHIVILFAAILTLSSVEACSVNSDCPEEECCLKTTIDDVSYLACGMEPIDDMEDINDDDNYRLLHNVWFDCMEIDYETASQMLATASILAATF